MDTTGCWEKNHRWGSRSGSRQTGQVDTVDLVIGVVLAILVPLLCLILAGVLGVKTRSDKFDFREKPNLVPVPDAEEIETHWKNAEQLYYENARPFLKNAESHEDPNMRYYFRKWAEQTIQNVDAKLSRLEALINVTPEGKQAFQSYIGRIAQRREEIRSDLEKARSLDIHAIDTAR